MSAGAGGDIASQREVVLEDEHIRRRAPGNRCDGVVEIGFAEDVKRRYVLLSLIAALTAKVVLDTG